MLLITFKLFQKKTMEEKNKDDKKNKNYASNGIPDELNNFKKICDSRCSICNSGILHKIHEWKKDGAKYDRIVERSQDEHNITISTAALSRHFKSYSAFKLEISTNIIKNDVLEEVTSQAVHIKKTVVLIDKAYGMIEQQIEKGLLHLGVSDLEKLTKIRYQILNGESTDEKDVLAIFQKAQDKYGVNLQQGVLFG